jgi:hypothetical protein
MKQSIYFYVYICDEYCLATREENQLLAFDLQSYSAIHGLGTSLALTEKIRVGTLVLPLNKVSKHDCRQLTTELNRELAVDLHPI